MNSFARIGWVDLLAGFAVTGCAVNKKLTPLHDVILVYKLAYDLTYLRAVHAIQDVKGWALEETDKEKGIIRVRNLDFSLFDDSDQRIISILIKRDSRSETSVQLAPESQRVRIWSPCCRAARLHVADRAVRHEHSFGV